MIRRMLLFSLFLTLLSVSVFSQVSIKIGENKKIVAVLESNGLISIGFQDLTLFEKDKPSFFIVTGNTTLGPFKNIQKKVVHSSDKLADSTEEITYFSINEKGKEYVLLGNFRFGPYESPEILKTHKNKLIVVDFTKKGAYYEVFATEGKSPKSISKSDLFADPITGIYVSDNMDVLISFDNNSSDPSQYFIYEGQKTDGFYHAVHFEGWMNTQNNTFTPVFSCVAPLDHESYDVTNDLYVGSQLIEKIVAVLYDFSFNSTCTDFIVKGYTAFRDGARVYTSDTVLGPYDAVNNLEFDSLNRITFEFDANEESFIYENGSTKPASIKRDYDWKNISPNGKDYLKCISGEESDTYFFNDQLIATGEPWNIDLVTWTQNYGPILFERIMKAAENGTDDQNWYGEVPAGFKLIINGESTKTFQSILDFKESPKGEIAYVVYENDGFYVFRGDDKHGPYTALYTIGKERENFLKWHGNDLIYSAISEAKSHVFINAESVASYQSIISFYWNQSFAHSAIVQIKDMKCFIESDFYSNPLDRDPFMEEQEEQFQLDLEERREELLSMEDCNSIHFNGKEYGGLTFIRNIKFCENGNIVSFQDLDELKIIYKDELLNGELINDKVVYYKNGNITLQNSTD